MVRDNESYLKTQQDLDDTHRADASDPHGATLTQSTAIFIGDTANANMTQGLTINQGAADDEILALKSSDVAHGATDYAETDTFAYVKKVYADLGGALFRGICDTDAGAPIALFMQALAGGTNTAKTTSADGAITLDSRKVSGTGATSLDANGNLAVIKDNGTARFIFDVEGSAHADVEWTTY